MQCSGSWGWCNSFATEFTRIYVKRRDYIYCCYDQYLSVNFQQPYNSHQEIIIQRSFINLYLRKRFLVHHSSSVTNILNLKIKWKQQDWQKVKSHLVWIQYRWSAPRCLTTTWSRKMASTDPVACLGSLHLQFCSMIQAVLVSLIHTPS